MKTIEITTAHNVTVQYGLAAVWERGMALALDLVIMTGASLIIWGLQAALFPASYDLAFYLLILPIWLLYTLLFEYFNNGQSPGKKILKIRVIRLDGERAFFLDYFMRWMFRGLDIYISFGGVAILAIISSSRNQRLGDLLANTVVVGISDSSRMNLQNLLKLNKLKADTITYPDVIRLNESTMVLVKEVLMRLREYDNESHLEAQDSLITKIEQALNLKSGADKELFLQTLLQDYILLTR